MNFLHKWLQRRVSPAGFERLSAAVLPWLAPLAWALLAVGAVWGLAFAPMDYQQKNSFRIIYIHVPAAMLSMSIYVLLALASLLFFVWRSRIAAFFARPDTLSLGVCNGCQMMSNLAEIIPGADGWAKFKRNESEQFEARLSIGARAEIAIANFGRNGR